MAEHTAHAPLEPIEPVSFTARLVRAPGAFYTEVDATPVVVVVDKAAVQPLTPNWATAWAALDGRPVAEALGIDPTALDAVAARNIIEVLRRLKAAGLVCDAASLRSGETTDSVAEQPAAGLLVLALHGRVEPTSDALGIVLGPSGPDTVQLSLREGADGLVASTPDGPVTSVVVAASPRNASRAAVDAVARLQGIVSAVADPGVLAEPGAIDLLAAFAELATTQSIPDVGS